MPVAFDVSVMDNPESTLSSVLRTFSDITTRAAEAAGGIAEDIAAVQRAISSDPAPQTIVPMPGAMTVVPTGIGPDAPLSATPGTIDGQTTTLILIAAVIGAFLIMRR